MDAKRLEELSRLVSYCVYDEGIAIETYLAVNDLRDLARCAAAWAKLEGIIRLSNSKATSFWVSDKGIGFLTPRSIHTASTAIEAVEAAKEVKPSDPIHHLPLL